MDYTQTHLSVSSSFSFVRATRGLLITLILGNKSDNAFLWMEFLLMTLGLGDIDPASLQVRYNILGLPCVEMRTEVLEYSIRFGILWEKHVWV